MKKITLTESIDFTRTKLCDYLNETHGAKTSGRAFTVSDVHLYIDRGYLPAKYGGHTLTQITNSKMGLKMIRVNFKKD